MLNVVLNLLLGDNPRDRIFVERTSLLSELLDFALDAVRAECGEPLVVADEVMLRSLPDKGRGIKVVASSDGADPLAAARAVCAAGEASSSSPFLVVSPFLGLVTRSAIRRFLDCTGGTDILASAHAVDANANPFWMSMISPLSRIDDSHYRDQNTTKLPRFSLAGGYINEEVWTRCFGDVHVCGSQWLPRLYKLDGALTYLPGAEGQGPIPVFLDDCRGEDVPLLYQLPIFLMSRVESASLCGSRVCASAERELLDGDSCPLAGACPAEEIPTRKGWPATPPECNHRQPRQRRCP